MIVTDRIDGPAFEAGTGWALKPEGACRGEVCVPLPPDAVTGDLVDVAAVAERLGMPLVTDHDSGAVAVGPAVLPGGALADARMPALVLPDLDGTPFDVRSLLGQKVLLGAWAPY